MKSLCVLGAGILALCMTATVNVPAAFAADIDDFFGTFVGRAEVVDQGTGEREIRDMDIDIRPTRRGGFVVTWINVTLVDGRRDVPGVKRRVQEAVFERAEDGPYFIATHQRNLFAAKAKIRPMEGDPLRWASIEDDALRVHSFQVLDDGRYEVQTYDRVLTDVGIDLVFSRIVDGEEVRRINGRTVRTE